MDTFGKHGRLACTEAAECGKLLSVGSNSAPEIETVEEYRWIIDRFSGTHLNDWSTPSLHREYKWRQGYYGPPCREELMRDREVEDIELNTEIAQRAVMLESKKRDGSPTGLNRTLLAKLRASAVDLLKAGRFHDAAVLFEYAIGEAPDNVDLLNDLGFCLIPHDPRRALAYLEDAGNRGYSHIGINLHNRALCKLLLGDSKAALDMINEAWSTTPIESATLWSPGGHSLELRQNANSRDELALVAYLAASNVGNFEAIVHWEVLAFDEDPELPSSG